MASIAKRAIDIFIASAALVVTSPLLALTALAIRLVDGPPVLFRQVRPGYKGCPFTLYKFRTMTDGRDSVGKLLPDASRLTHIGLLMRAFSIDELPQFWNVLRGEMTIVGPRPLLLEYLARYTPEQARRHDVLPGITGWAQINGRNALSWEEKFALDLWYVDHQTFLLDLKIIGLSFWKVLTREAVSQAGHATAEEFTGNGQKGTTSVEPPLL